jgi:hypothetical protein
MTTNLAGSTGFEVVDISDLENIHRARKVWTGPANDFELVGQYLYLAGYIPRNSITVGAVDTYSRRAAHSSSHPGRSTVSIEDPDPVTWPDLFGPFRPRVFVPPCQFHWLT